MKKVLAVMLALVMAFSLCIPSFAETTAEAGGLDFGAILETVTGIIGGFLPSDAALPSAASSVPSVTSSAVSAAVRIPPALPVKRTLHLKTSPPKKRHRWWMQH